MAHRPDLRNPRRPDHLRWFWALNGILGKPADLQTDNRVASLEEAKRSSGKAGAPGWSGRSQRDRM